MAPSVLAPSIDVAGRRFGFAVATSDDARVVVVGAPEDTANGVSAGAAHVFVRTGGALLETAVLRSSANAELDQLGSHVAISGDGTRIAIGAPYAGSVDGGAIVVFVDVGGVWTEEATLIPTRTSNGDELSPVSLDATGSTLLAGAPNASSPSCAGCGAAFVFTRDATGWSESATLVSPTPAPFEKMGQAVAISRDGLRAVVGIPREDTTSVDTGGARTFVRSGAIWTHEALLAHGDALPNDLCGLSVAIDGVGDLVALGCPLDDSARGMNAGTLRVFSREAGGWSGDVTIAARDASDGDQLGQSIAITTDGARIVAGASGDVVAPSTIATGSVRTFDRVGATWAEGEPVSIAGLAEDRFGRAVGVAADGVSLVVGADLADSAAGESSGAAWAVVLSAERGEPCARDSYCATGACVDGVCCESACGGGALDDCQACSAALTGRADGTCSSLDAVAAPATVCRPAGGDCDVAERCTIGSTACPIDGFVVADTECRAAVTACDLSERCTGEAAACPDDVIASEGTPCRAPAGVCDAMETCDGVSALCPRDRPVAEGTGCGDGNACNGEERCTSGVCVVAVVLDCDDDDLCTADACDAALGCSHTDVAGCCRLDLDCVDSESCTVDRCDVATGTCSHVLDEGCVPSDAGPVLWPDAGIEPVADAGARDAALDPFVDAGATPDADHDAGLTEASDGGCGCRVHERRTGSSARHLVMALAAMIAGASRRRRRAAVT